MSDALPHGWATTSLGALCDDRVTQGPPTAEPVQYIDISSIDRSAKRVGETTLVTDRDAPTRARQWVRTDDVLVSMTRPNLNAVAQVGPELDGAVASTGFDVLRLRAVDPRWIFYRVRTNDFVADVCEGLQGVVYPAIRPRDVRRHELPLPPLPEQHRIVSAIESYFTRLDDAVATLERVQRNLKRYRASVLKAAVEGRLVPTEAELARAEGRSYEPASVLLTRILAERRRRWEEAELAKMTAKGKAPKDDKWKAKYVEPIAPDTSQLPKLPEGWCWVSMDALCFVTKLAGFEYTKHVSYQTDGDLPVIKAENAGPDGFRPTAFSRVRSAEVAGLIRSRLEPNDLLMVFVGAGTGQVGRVPSDQQYFLGPNIAMMRVTSRDAMPEYLEFYLRSPLGNRLSLGFSKAVAQPSLSMGTIRKIPVALPPRSEQERIVSAIEQQTSVRTSVWAESENTRRRVVRLRQSILKWAFEGRLVDQDPTDEPASVLLERIRAERATATDTPPRRARRSKARAPKS
jgi:type I restriction enzyme, S subunit